MTHVGHNSAVRGTFADFKTVKTRGVCQLIIEVPIEAADQALTMLGGVPQAKAEQWVGIAPVTAPDAPQKLAETEAPKLKGGPICKRAVLLCKNESFTMWLAKSWRGYWDNALRQHNGSTEHVAKHALYQMCGIESRAHLDHDEIAAGTFKKIEQQYHDSQRGWSEGASR